MHQQLAYKLALNKDRLVEIEVATGVTAQTMRNIIAKPEGKRQKAVIKALETYFNRRSKK